MSDLSVPAPPDSLDCFFAQQQRRIASTLGRLDVRLERRRKAGLSVAYEEAESLHRLAQIATNAGRVVLPGIEQYDDISHTPSAHQGTPWPVDKEAAIRRKYAVVWAANPRWVPPQRRSKRGAQ
jgi:hypothetical protein